MIFSHKLKFQSADIESLLDVKGYVPRKRVVWCEQAPKNFTVFNATSDISLLPAVYFIVSLKPDATLFLKLDLLVRDWF